MAHVIRPDFGETRLEAEGESRTLARPTPKVKP